MYICIYMHTYIRQYLPNATCLINTTSFVLCAVCSVKDHHNLPKSFVSLKKTCVRPK